MAAIQVFTDNPTAWRRRSTLPHELPAFRDRLAGARIRPLVVHAPYLVTSRPPSRTFHDPVAAVLATSCASPSAWGAAFVNVHLGSHRGSGVDAGIAASPTGLCRVLETVGGRRRGSRSFSRTAPAPASGSGRRRGAGAGRGGAVATGVARERFAYCLDVAHLWGAGYPWTSRPASTR